MRTIVCAMRRRARQRPVWMPLIGCLLCNCQALPIVGPCLQLSADTYRAGTNEGQAEYQKNSRKRNVDRAYSIFVRTVLSSKFTIMLSMPWGGRGSADTVVRGDSPVFWDCFISLLLSAPCEPAAIGILLALSFLKLGYCNP